uniref:Uncharacterized protein n=1 Tax=Anopheles atroparvus TaxID=41427 RepID=A0A182IZM0_ANOAO
MTKSPPCSSIFRSLPEKSTIGSSGTMVDSRMKIREVFTFSWYTRNGEPKSDAWGNRGTAPPPPETKLFSGLQKIVQLLAFRSTAPRQVDRYEPDGHEQLEKLILHLADRGKRFAGEVVLLGEALSGVAAALGRFHPSAVRVQHRQVIAVGDRKLALAVIRLVALAEGRHERALVAENGRDRKHTIQALEDRSEQHQLAYPNVHRQRCQMVPERRQLLLEVERAHIDQALFGRLNVLHARWLDGCPEHRIHRAVLQRRNTVNRAPSRTGSGLEQLFHGEGATGDVQHRHVAKVAGEQVRVQRGRHKNNLQVGPLRKQFLQYQQQKVGLLAAFVHLVDNDVRHGGERWVGLQATQKDTRGAESQPRGGGYLVLQPDLVPDRVSNFLVALLRHTFRHADRGQTPRLRADDLHVAHLLVGFQLRRLQQPVVEQKLRHLRRLSTARFPADNEYLMRFHEGDDFTHLSPRRQVPPVAYHLLPWVFTLKSTH